MLAARFKLTCIIEVRIVSSQKYSVKVMSSFVEGKGTTASNKPKSVHFITVFNGKVKHGEVTNNCTVMHNFHGKEYQCMMP
jgi:hypothetical protein